MMRKRMSAIALALLLVPALGACGNGVDAVVDYPTQTIRIIVPFSAGGGFDLSARMMANALSAELEQAVVVENMPGASGAVGWTECYNAEPDGYTLAIANSSVAIDELVDSPPYDYSGFTYLMQYANDPYLVVATAGSGIKSAEELSAYAKDHRVIFGCGSHATEFSCVDLASTMRINDYDIVPFGGLGDAMLAVASGDCMAGCAGLATVQSQIEAGRLTPLCVMSRERLSQYPDIPTVDEIGLPGLYHGVIRGYIAPPNTPQEICNILTDAMYRAVERDDYKEAEANLGLTRNILTGEEFKAEMETTYEKYARLIALEQSWNQ